MNVSDRIEQISQFNEKKNRIGHVRILPSLNIYIIMNPESATHISCSRVSLSKIFGGSSFNWFLFNNLW